MKDNTDLPFDAEAREEAVSLIATVRSLPAVRRYQDEIEQLMTDIDAAQSTRQSGLIVCLVGSTGAGKSTLINALAGSEIAREGVDRPTTSVPTVYAPDDAEVDSLSLPATPGATIRRYNVAADASWSGHVLIDAPDVNSTATEHRALTQALAEASDVLLIVMHRQSVVEASSVEFLDAYRQRRHLVFVLGRCDELSDQSRESVVKQIRRFVETRWKLPDAPVFAVSAKQAQEDPRNAGEFLELLEYLRSIEDKTAAKRVRRDSVLGAASRLAELFGTICEETEGRVEVFSEDLEVLFSKVKERFEPAVSQIIDRYTDDVESLLRAQLGFQWKGAIGIALRMGAMGRISLGLSGMLARRSPLLSVAVLAGTRAYGNRVLEQQVDGLKEADLTEAMAEQVGDWCRAEETDFQMRAARLNIEVPHLAQSIVPSLKEHSDIDWGSQLCDALPDAARRALPGRVRLALNLPLYALGLWVLVRACYGLLTDDLVGFDLVLTVGILAGAWVTFAVWVAQWRLRKTTRELLGQTTRIYLSGFDHAVESAKRQALEPVSAVYSSLDRLRFPLYEWESGTEARVEPDQDTACE